MSKLITTCQGDLLKRFFFRKDSFFCLSLKLERISSWLSHKNFSAVSSKPLSVCPLQQFVVKIFSVKNVFLSSFSDIQQKLVNFFKTLSIKLTKLHSTRPQDHFEDISLFWQSFCLFFQWFMEIKRRNNGFFCRKTIGSFVNPAYHVSKGILCREFFPMFFFFIIGHWATFPCHFYGNLLVPLSVLFSACQMDQFVVKKLLSKNVIFGHWPQNDQSLFDVFLAKLTTLHSTGPRDQFEDIWPFWQTFVCFIYSLRTLSQKIKAFFRGTIDRFVKIAHHVSKVYFAGKFFSKKILFLFDHWALIDFCLSFWRKHVGPFVSTVFCLSIWPVCGEKNFVKYFFPIIFGHRSQIDQSLFEFFFGQVDDTAFYRSKGSIWGHKAVLTNFCLFYLSFADLEPKNQGFFSGNNDRVVKIAHHVSKGYFAGNFFSKKFLFLFDHWALIDFCLKFRRKFVGSLVSTVFCSSIRPVSGEKMFVQTFFSMVYGHSAKICLFFFWKNFGQLNKTAFYECRGKIWGQNIVLTKLLFVFSCSSKFERRNNGFFVIKTIGKFVTFAYHVSKKIL